MAKVESIIETNNKFGHKLLWFLLTTAILGTIIGIVLCHLVTESKFLWIFILWLMCISAFHGPTDLAPDPPVTIPPACPRSTCVNSDLREGHRPRPEGDIQRENTQNIAADILVGGATFIASIATGGLVPLMTSGMQTASHYSGWECPKCRHFQIGGHELRYPRAHEFESGYSCGVLFVACLGVFAAPVGGIIGLVLYFS